MSRLHPYAAFPVALGLSLAGCGGSGGETLSQPTQPPAPTAAEATHSAVDSCATGALGWPDLGPAATSLHTAGDAPAMVYTTLETADASPDVATIQRTVGKAALSAVVGKDIPVCIDNVPFTVRIAVPSDPKAREQTVVFTADSANAGAILAANGFTDQADVKNSVTVYGVNSQTFKREGGAVSVVGQETTGVGLIHNVATEFCQPTDLKSEPKPEDASRYTLLKEAVCNQVGAAADRVFLGQPYESYRLSVLGKPLRVESAAGHNAVYVPVTEQVYAGIQAAFRAQ